MAWKIGERADAFNNGQQQGRGAANAAYTKNFVDNSDAEERVKAWQKELKAKKARS